ncbi:MAG: FHA domain-containing protein, partial [Chloroflexales bacterium]|nr:FHA domain-containing protein [Chloroflexales bacterium]
MSPQIVALRGPLAGQSFPLAGAPLTFGRTPDNTVVIASPLASRRHAEVRLEAGAYTLYDLGSSNGTRLNGQPASAQRLSPGDIFEIGDEAFRFEQPAAIGKTLVAGAAQPAPSPPTAAPATPLPPSAQPPHPLPPLPAAQWGAVTPRPAARLPLILVVVALLGCALLAAMAGGALLIARGFNPSAEPSGTGCAECLATGSWWFHLRRCTECGHIGCCDSSPNVRPADKVARRRSRPPGSSIVTLTSPRTSRNMALAGSPRRTTSRPRTSTNRSVGSLPSRTTSVTIRSTTSKRRASRSASIMVRSSSACYIMAEESTVSTW